MRSSMRMMAKRTVVRDPRKRIPRSSIVPQEDQLPEQHQQNQQQFFLQQPEQQSLGSSMGTYVVMGASMTMGMVLVRVLFGV